MAITTYHNQQVGDACRQQWLTRGDAGYFLEDSDFDLLVGLTDEEAEEAMALHCADRPFDTAALIEKRAAADNP